MSLPTSPVLQNSSFSHFDYFATGERRPIFAASLTSSPSSSTSSPRIQSTPERSRASSVCPLDSGCPSSEPQLGSPRVLTFSKLGVKRISDLARRPVQLCDKAAVNWARPLRVEREAERTFDASLQRNLRFDRSHMPSPSSSDDEPLTPSPVTPAADDTTHRPSRGWSVPSTAKGLGVSGVAEWDPPIIPLRELGLDPLPEFAFEPLDLSPATPLITFTKPTVTHPPPKPQQSLPQSQAQAVTTPSTIEPRILATSRSLSSLSSPSNLEELHNLRQAAGLLESEARKPIRPSFGLRDGTRERKIKRKAVPRLVELDLLEASPASLDVPVDEDFRPAYPRRTSVIETSKVSREVPGSGISIFDRQRQLYQCHRASQSMSMIDSSIRPRTGISPRTISSPRTVSPSHFRLDEGSSYASSGSSLEDQPMTPTSLSTSQTQYFLSRVETAFRKLEVERANLGGKDRGSGTIIGKHKRGFSRFFGNNGR